MNPLTSLLLTDLYQLTMLQGYVEQGMDKTAVFEFHVRSLPGQRNFLISAGQEESLNFLEHMHITQEELFWLSRTGRFSNDFLDYLEVLRFSGDVHMLPEGTICFPYEPIFRVTAPLPQAQLVESRLINILHLHTMLASKAVRCVLTAPDKQLIDFGLRRAHGAEAGLAAARTSYMTGFAGTATVLAGALYDIPIYGTMAHSFIEAHDDELAAFEHFAQAQPKNVVLLIDTYDTEKAAEKLRELAPKLSKRGININAVRLDSGDLAAHAFNVRRILDAAGLGETKIFASGDLDEYRLHEIISQGAPIDGFGVGTKMDTSADAPYLDCAYKLMEYDGQGRRKKSEGKITWPGRKQVYREFNQHNKMIRDTVTLETEKHAGEALLRHSMAGGRRLSQPRPLNEIRSDVQREISRLPGNLLTLSPADYPVEISAEVRKLAAEVDRKIEQNQ